MKREGRNKGRKELWEGSRKEGVRVGGREGRKEERERGRRCGGDDSLQCFTFHYFLRCMKRAKFSVLHASLVVERDKCPRC